MEDMYNITGLVSTLILILILILEFIDINLVFGDLILNVISAYAPQVGLSDDVKRLRRHD
jgi:hypothetical protein